MQKLVVGGDVRCTASAGSRCCGTSVGAAPAAPAATAAASATASRTRCEPLVSPPLTTPWSLDGLRCGCNMSGCARCSPSSSRCCGTRRRTRRGPPRRSPRIRRRTSPSSRSCSSAPTTSARWTRRRGRSTATSWRTVAAAAAAAGTAVVIGFAERNEDGSCSNSVACIDRDGTLAGVYRKTQLYAGERKVFRPGRELRIVRLAGVAVAPLICFDVEFPEPVRALALAGAELLVTASANMEPFAADHELATRARALENRLPHLYANAVGTIGRLSFVGLSRSVGPAGEVLARGGRGGGAAARPGRDGGRRRREPRLPEPAARAAAGCADRHDRDIIAGQVVCSDRRDRAWRSALSDVTPSAAEAGTSAKLFVRQSSGLVRNVSVTNALFFNVAAFVGVGLTLYPIFYSLAFVPVWTFGPLSEYGWAAIFTGLFCVVLALIFASLTSVMPRSGGDYVFSSRIVASVPRLARVVDARDRVGADHRLRGPARPAQPPDHRADHRHRAGGHFFDNANTWFTDSTGGITGSPGFLASLVVLLVIGVIVCLPTRTFHKVVTSLAGFGVACFIAMFIFGLASTSRSSFDTNLPQYTGGVTAAQDRRVGQGGVPAGRRRTHFLSAHLLDDGVPVHALDPAVPVHRVPVLGVHRRRGARQRQARRARSRCSARSRSACSRTRSSST